VDQLPVAKYYFRKHDGLSNITRVHFGRNSTDMGNVSHVTSKHATEGTDSDYSFRAKYGHVERNIDNYEVGTSAVPDDIAEETVDEFKRPKLYTNFQTAGTNRVQPNDTVLVTLPDRGVHDVRFKVIEISHEWGRKWITKMKVRSGSRKKSSLADMFVKLRKTGETSEDFMEDLVDDVTPTLGGPLDLNGNYIEDTSDSIVGFNNDALADITTITVSGAITDGTYTSDGTGGFTGVAGITMTGTLTLSAASAAITHSGATSLTISSTSGFVAVESIQFAAANIGVSGDTDLLQLAANSLVVNGAITGTTDITISGTFTDGTMSIVGGALSSVTTIGCGAITSTSTGVFQGASVTVGTTVQAGTLILYDGSDHAITIGVPAIAASWTLTLPTVNGDASQYLQTDGAGATTWATVTSGIASVVADITPQLGGNLDCNTNTITGCTQITDSGTHVKRLPISLLTPDNGYTAGNNNCYWSRVFGTPILFGITAYTNGYMGGSFIVPPTCKEGTDIKLRCLAYGVGGAVANIDCIVFAGCTDAGIAQSWEINAVTNLHSPDALGAGNVLEDFTITLPDATLDFNPGDEVYFIVSMDDNTATRVISTHGWCIEYEVDEYD